MPVQIPRLKRIQPSPTQPGAGRFRFKVPDQADTILGRTQAIGSLVGKGIDIVIDVEDTKIDQLSRVAEQEYSLWNTDQLQKLKNVKGDPTDAYVAYDIAEREKVEEIMGRNPNVNDRVKRHLTSNLAKVQDSTRIEVLKQHGLQQTVYDNNIFEANVKLKKNNLGKTAGYISRDDPSSFLMFDQNVAEIKTLIAKRAVQNGTAVRLPDDAKKWSHIYTDNEGEVVKVGMTNIPKLRIVEEISDGVTKSITNLIDTGFPEEAKMLNERYKDSIDTLDAGKIARKFAASDLSIEASKVAREIEQLPEGERSAAIKKAGEKNPKLGDKVLGIVSTNINRRASMRNNREDKNYDKVYSKLIELRKEGRLSGLSDLESTTEFKGSWSLMSPKQQQAILDEIKAPKTSSVSSQAKIQNLFFGNDPDFKIETITPIEFNIFLSGLDPKDRRKHTKTFESLRTETAGEQRAGHKRADSFMIDALLLHGEIERNKFGDFDEDDTIIIIEERNKIIDRLDSQVGTFKDKELKDFVNESVAARVNDKIFNPKPRREVIEKETKELILTAKEKVNFKLLFRTEHGFMPKSTSEEFKNFVRKIRSGQ